METLVDIVFLVLSVLVIIICPLTILIAFFSRQEGALKSAFISVFILLFSYSFGLFFYLFIAPEEKINEYEIITPVFSINALSTVNGSFTLGSGYIEEEQYYFYHIRDKKGNLVLKKSLVEEITINNKSEKEEVFISEKVTVYKKRWFQYEVKEGMILNVPENKLELGFDVNIK